MARTVRTSGSTSPKLPRFRSARGGATLAVAVERRRGCAGRFAPLPGAGRALRGAAGPLRAGAFRGAVRRPDDDAAGFRPTRCAAELPGAVPPDVARLVVEPLGAVPFAGDAFAAVPRPAAPRAAPFAAVPCAAVLFAAVLPFAPAPFAVELEGFFGAALPLPVGGVLFAAEAPEPVRGVDGRAPEPRAGPEGRVGRREEGMGRLCRFAGPLYRHYLRRAVCRTCGTQELSDTNGRVRRPGHPSDPDV